MCSFLEMFLLNGLSALVLFDLGATQSFVSLVLSRKFGDVSGALGYLLEVKIAYDLTVSAQGCVLELFYENYLVDLVPILLQGTIVGMDWLRNNGATIDCERQLVRFRTPSMGELIIHGDDTQRVPYFCLVVRARIYL